MLLVCLLVALHCAWWDELGCGHIRLSEAVAPHFAGHHVRYETRFCPKTLRCHADLEHLEIIFCSGVHFASFRGYLRPHHCASDFDNLVGLANEAFNALAASHQYPLWNATRAIIVDRKWSVRISLCNERSAFSIHAFASMASAFKTYMAQDGGGPPPLLPIKFNWCPEFSVSPILSAAPFQVMYFWAKHIEKVWTCLDSARKKHQLPKDIDPTEPTQPIGSGEAVAPLLLATVPDTWTKPDQWFGSEDLDKYLVADLRDVLVFLKSFPLADGPRVVKLVQILKVMLGSLGHWLLWGNTMHKIKP